MARYLKLDIIGDASSLSRAFGRGAKEAGKFHGAISRMGSGLRSFAGIATGALSGLAIGATIEEMVKQVTDWQKIGGQTAAVLESTGAKAWTSKSQIEALASTLQDLSGVDDDLIQRGQNMLLTFTNLQNRAGQGNDIFNQATKSLVDMAVAMGDDPQKAAIRLGKALNDPVSGMTALKRVGVTFSAEQKKRIEGYMKEGKVAEAQKVILAELNKEFGGSAAAAGKTLPAQIAKLKDSFIEFGAGILQKALPAVTGFVKRGAAKFKEFEEAFKRGGIKEALKTLVPPEFRASVDKVFAAFGKLKSQLAPVGQFIAKLIPQDATGRWTLAAGLIGGILVGAFAALAVAVWSAIAPLLPFIAIGVALGAIALVIQRNWSKIAPYFKAIVAVLGPVFAQLKQFFASNFGYIVGWVRSNMPLIKAVIVGQLRALAGVWKAIWAVIKAVVPPVWRIIKIVVGTAIRSVLGVIKAVMQLLTGNWRGAWTTIKQVAITLFQGAKASLGTIAAALGRLLSAAWAAIKSGASAAWSGIKRAIISAVTSLPGAMVKIGGQIAKGLWQGIKAAAGWLARAVMAWVRSVIPDPIERLLRISSPSRLMRDIGRNAGLSIGLGLDDTAERVRSSAIALGEQIQRGTVASIVTDDHSSASSKSVTNNLTLNLTTAAPTPSVLSDIRLMRILLGANT